MKPESGKYDPNRGPEKKSKLGSNREPKGSHPGRAGLYGQPKNSQGYSPKGPQKPSGEC